MLIFRPIVNPTSSSSETYLFACLVDFFSNCSRYSRYCILTMTYRMWEVKVLGFFCDTLNMIIVTKHALSQSFSGISVSHDGLNALSEAFLS